MPDRVLKLKKTKNPTMLSPWTVDEVSNGFFLLFISGVLALFLLLEKNYNVEGKSDYFLILSYLGLAGFIWIFLILNKKMKIARAFESDGINIDGVVVKKYTVGYDGYIKLHYAYNYEGDSYAGEITVYESIFKDYLVGDSLTIRFLPDFPYTSRPILTF